MPRTSDQCAQVPKQSPRALYYNEAMCVRTCVNARKPLRIAMRTYTYAMLEASNRQLAYFSAVSSIANAVAILTKCSRCSKLNSGEMSIRLESDAKEISMCSLRTEWRSCSLVAGVDVAIVVRELALCEAFSDGRIRSKQVNVPNAHEPR